MNERELLEYIAAQIGTLTNRVDTLTNQVGTLTNHVDNLTNQVGILTKDVAGIKDELKDVNVGLDKIVDGITTIEQDHGRKLEAVYDENKQNTETLHRIEKEVSKQEEIVLRRIN